MWRGGTGAKKKKKRIPSCHQWSRKQQPQPQGEGMTRPPMMVWQSDGETTAFCSYKEKKKKNN